jgi:hypothetical protein
VLFPDNFAGAWSQVIIQDEQRRAVGRVDLNFHVLKQMNVLQEIFALMRNSPGKTFGEGISESTGGANLVDGKQTWELALGKKDDLQAMKKCCDAELATYEQVGLVPAPYYFERVAILARKAKNFREEIAWCEKYIAVVADYYRKNNIPENQGVRMGSTYKAITHRLTKARLLLGEELTVTL